MYIIKKAVESDSLFCFYLSLRYVDLLGATIDKIVGEVVNQTPVEILVHIAKTVALCRQIEHIETLVCTNQSIHYARCISGVNVVVNLAVNEQQVALQLLGNLGVTANLIDECSVTLLAHLLLYAVVSLAPPTVVNLVVVVTRARYSRLEEVGVLQDCSC